MGKCESHIRETRFYIDDLTHCYVYSDAYGDCPLNVQGWHHKAFPASVSAQDILKGEFKDYLLWPLDAPPDGGGASEAYSREQIDLARWVGGQIHGEPIAQELEELADALSAGDFEYLRKRRAKEARS